MSLQILRPLVDSRELRRVLPRVELLGRQLAALVRVRRSDGRVKKSHNSLNLRHFVLRGFSRIHDRIHAAGNFPNANQCELITN